MSKNIFANFFLLCTGDVGRTTSVQRHRRPTFFFYKKIWGKRQLGSRPIHLFWKPKLDPKFHDLRATISADQRFQTTVNSVIRRFRGSGGLWNARSGWEKYLRLLREVCTTFFRECFIVSSRLSKSPSDWSLAMPAFNQLYQDKYIPDRFSR